LFAACAERVSASSRVARTRKDGVGKFMVLTMALDAMGSGLCVLSSGSSLACARAMRYARTESLQSEFA
jgi:hypothetical protein